MTSFKECSQKGSNSHQWTHQPKAVDEQSTLQSNMVLTALTLKEGDYKIVKNHTHTAKLIIIKMFYIQILSIYNNIYIILKYYFLYYNIVK